MFEVMHVGVPVKEPKVGEEYAEGLKVYITSPDKSDFGFEYLRFDHDTPMHKEIVDNVHIAYKVDLLERYLEKYEVLEKPMKVSDELRIAFVKIDNVVIELMEFSE